MVEMLRAGFFGGGGGGAGATGQNATPSKSGDGGIGIALFDASADIPSDYGELILDLLVDGYVEEAVVLVEAQSLKALVELVEVVMVVVMQILMYQTQRAK